MAMDEDEVETGTMRQLSNPYRTRGLPAWNETSPEQEIERKLEAAKATRVLLGCFRSGEASDPEVYRAAVEATLADYPSEIIRRVADPRSGLPRTSKWLPTVSEIREACEKLAHPPPSPDYAAQAKAQLAARREWIEGRKNRPTLEDLKAMYGPTWGLQAVADKESEETKAKRRETLAKANKLAFERECIAAGMPPDSPISPSLLKLLARQAEDRANE